MAYGYRNPIKDYSKMNVKNLELHAIKKAKSMINTQVYSKNTVDIIVYSDSSALRCYKCPQDDFGYCGLRTSNIGNEDMWIKYCAPAFLKLTESENK